MNFEAKNLDESYNQIKKLNDLSMNEGNELSQTLYSNINSLQKNWKGTDATKYINDLILVYEAMCRLVTEISSVSNEVSKPIVKAQTIRNLNGGRGEIGQLLQKKEVTPIAIEKLEDTAEYFVSPDATTDYDNLNTLTENFVKFEEKFLNSKEELLNNWTVGSDRPRAIYIFNDFESNSGSYKKTLNEVKQNLSTAISNMTNL